MRKTVIIVAGGKGLRMGGELPKQFIPIADKPILMHTLEAFYQYDAEIHIILVLPESHRAYWDELCDKYSFSLTHQITNGGETRFHSVLNGLSFADDGLIAIHDGARPFVSAQLIDRCFENARKYQTAIPVIDATDSLREIVNESESRIVDRSKIKLVQTPQVFTAEVIKKAYETIFKPTFTDDASVVEHAGMNVHLVEGEITNIKVTTPLDLEIAKIIKPLKR